MNKKSFFRRSDWVAFWVTCAISLVVYTLTLQPTVGLEDSGELIVASDYLGVPHPPGYPIWSLLTWVFQWIFNFVTYHGHPNPAWGVNFFSAFSGAVACGVIALLVSRSGMDFVRGIKGESEVLGEKTESMFSCVAGIVAGLLLAFSQGMWSQSVIAEVYSLNIAFQSLMLLFLYKWMVNPADRKSLWLMAFTYGLGMTNHQTLMFMGLAVALAILLRDIRLFRDFAIVGVFYLFMFAFQKFGPLEWAWTKGPERGMAFWVWSAYALVIPLLALFLPNGKTVCFTCLLVFLGLSFYMYMPLASEQNPPINWGYARTWDGFMHAITRGQYDRVVLADVLHDPGDFINKAKLFFVDLNSQFYLPLVLVGLLPFAGWQVVGRKKTLRMFIPATVLVVFGGVLWLRAVVVEKEGDLAVIMTGVVALLFALLVTAGLSIIALNFIKRVYSRVKTFGKNVMDWVAVAVVFLLGIGAALVGLFVDIMFLMSLPAHDYSIGTTLIILGVIFLPIIVVVAVVLLRYRQIEIDFDICFEEQHWLATTLLAFLGVGLVFIILQNPKLDMASQFVGRVQYIQSHAVYSIWIGYGLLLLMSGFQVLTKNRSITKWAGTVLVLLLPLVLIAKNYYDSNQLISVGGSEQNGHGFGWEFGNWELRGVEGIKDDLWYYSGKNQEKFDEMWAEYPNPEYPPPMGENAIFFGGTDPGRFVPTYMIYCPKIRQDIYLITQNALADSTYLSVMRDLYGDQIWIPSKVDFLKVFYEYVDKSQKKQTHDNADIKKKGQRVEVHGIDGVMNINGGLSKEIFHNNQFITEEKTDEKTRQSGAAVVSKDPLGKNDVSRLRDFYVEESYVLKWMYPYLTPHGLIMKINNEPTKLTSEMIKNDHDFWTWNTKRLIGDKKFLRDVVARKTFAKLRGSIANLYLDRGILEEAEYALKQSLELYPYFTEAAYRLSNLYVSGRRYTDARELIENLASVDVDNSKASDLLKQLRKFEKLDLERIELEKQFKTGTVSGNTALRLVDIYMKLMYHKKTEKMVSDMLNSKLSPQIYLQLTQMMLSVNQFTIASATLMHYVNLNPRDLKAQIDLAALTLQLGRKDDATKILKNVVESGGAPMKSAIRKDIRFKSLIGDPEFEKVVPPLNRSFGDRSY